MDEQAYKQTYHEVNNQRCVFEKMMLLRYGSCEQAQKLLLAERETMSCLSSSGQKNCQLLLNISRQKARFSLQITQANAPLPHAKELKVQAGSLYGLQQYLLHKDTSQTTELNDEKLKFDNKTSQPIPNIIKTINAALKQFNQIELFPYEQMIKSIMHFTLPTRRRSRKK